MDNFDLKKYLAEGRLFEEDFKNPILDKYLELKKSVDNNTAFEYELSDFINDLDNTEREGLESDLGLERDELYEGRLLKEELTFSFDEYSYEIDDDAYQAEVEAGIKAQLPNISDEVLQAIIDSSVEYYYDQREEDVPSSDIVDMAVNYYNEEMVGDSKPSAPRQKYDLSSIDLSGLDKGQKSAFNVFVDVYLKPYGDTDTQEELERYVRQFGKVEDASDIDSIIPNSFQYDSDERENIQSKVRNSYLFAFQPIN
jgi:hypothetical protein